MAKTMEDVLAQIVEYAKKYDLDADDVAGLFADGCSICGGAEFLPLKKAESTGPPFVVKCDIVYDRISLDEAECEECEGTGQRAFAANIPEFVTCIDCGGSGKIK